MWLSPFTSMGVLSTSKHLFAYAQSYHSSGQTCTHSPLSDADRGIGDIDTKPIQYINASIKCRPQIRCLDVEWEALQ